MPRKGRNELDRRIGLRIRERRKALRMSQKTLAADLGISYQQLNKYEIAQNRIAASTLAEVAHLLDMPVAWFFLQG